MNAAEGGRKAKPVIFFIPTPLSINFVNFVILLRCRPQYYLKGQINNLRIVNLDSMYVSGVLLRCTWSQSRMYEYQRFTVTPARPFTIRRLQRPPFIVISLVKSSTHFCNRYRNESSSPVVQAQKCTCTTGTLFRA